MKKKWFSILMAALFALGVTGCGGNPPTATPAAGNQGGQPTTAPAGKVKIGLTMDSLESAFWVANEKAIKAEAEKSNVELIEVMAEGDPNKQNQQCDNLIAQGVQALIIAPKDGAAIEACVQKAKNAKIPVIMDNRPVQGDIKPDLQILSDNETMAKQALQWFVDKAKKEGKTYKALLLIGNLGDENAVLRKKGHMAVADANKDVIDIVAQVPTEWKHEVALAGMQNAFQAHPDINLIITPSDFLWPPMKSVLQQVNKWAKIGDPNHVSVVSFDGDENGMQMLRDGYSEVDAAQAADTTGILAVQWALKLIKGEKPAQIDMLDPGIIANVDNCSTECPKIWGWAGTKASTDTGNTGANTGKKIKVGLTMDSLESAFWVANEKAIKAEAAKSNVELVEVMAEGDPNKQNQQCDNLIAQGVQALIIAPKDGAAIEACVQKAKNAKIPVIMDNRPVQGDIKPDLQILSDNETMAKQALQWFVDKAKKEGKTYKALLLIGNLGDENAVLRKKGHMAVADANKDVIEIVAQVPTEWKHEVALAGMQNAFQAHPDINLIITPSDFLWPPMKSVLQQTNKWGKIGEANHVSVVSFDGDENGMQMLRDGYSEVDAAQAADTTGILAVQWAIKLVNGEKPPQVDMLDPGIIANVDNCPTECPKIWGWAGTKGGNEPSTGGNTTGKKYKVGLTMDSLESAFWVANEKAIKAEAAKSNVELVEVMAEGDPNKQNQQCDNLIAQGVQALIIAPKDGAAIEACVQKAKNAKIPVVMDNRPVQGDIKPDLQILSDNETMAKQALQWFVDKAKKEGKTYKALLLIGNLGDENAVLRKKGHMAVADANKDVIEIVAQVPTEWKHEVALAGMQNAFQAHPDINLIITPSDFLWPPMKSVLQQTNKWGKIGEANHVSVVSFDGDENGMQMLKDKYSEVDAAQAADTTGILAVQWAIKLINGEKPPQVDMLDPGIIANVDNCSTECPKIWGWAGTK